MKLLVVMSHYPYPADTGSAIVAYNHIKELSKKHAIHLLSLDIPRTTGDLQDNVEHLEFGGRKAVSVFMKKLRRLSWLIYMFLGVPGVVATNRSCALQAKVALLEERNKYDALILYEMSAIQYCPPHCYAKTIAHIEDPQSLKLKRMWDLSIWPTWMRIGLFIDTWLTSRYEKNCFPKLAKILLFSKADATKMHELGGHKNIGFVRYGVRTNLTSEIIDFNGRDSGAIVFSGNMFHPPNVEAALYLLAKIFPLVQNEYPTAVLWIVGADPDTRIRKAARKFGNSVVITGRVSDLSKYLRRAIVSVCPVRLEIGVQTKILEALSWGTPVVTTSQGNSGVGGQTGHDLWVEDDPKLFAYRILRLLRGDEWMKFSRNGRQYVLNHFSWRSSATAMDKQIMRVKRENEYT